MSEYTRDGNGLTSTAVSNVRMVYLVSQDGEAFQVPISVARLSKLVATMIENDGDHEETTMEIQEIPLPNVPGHILVKVIKFMHHYDHDPMVEIDKPLKSSSMAEVVQEWYANFVKDEQDFLYELILAANYMDIQPLIDLTCASVAGMMKEKSQEELYAAFGIENDFTPEEEARVREANKWAEERGY